jgi:hypothetical protein
MKKITNKIKSCLLIAGITLGCGTVVLADCSDCTHITTFVQIIWPDGTGARLEDVGVPSCATQQSPGVDLIWDCEFNPNNPTTYTENNYTRINNQWVLTNTKSITTPDCENVSICGG